MRRYRTEIDNVRAHLRSLWAVIGLQFLVILGLWFGWSQAPKQLTVHVPPSVTLCGWSVWRSIRKPTPGTWRWMVLPVRDPNG